MDGSEFNSNGFAGYPYYSGIYIEASGNISLSSVTASGNGGSGGWLDPPAPASILIDNSIFSSNGQGNGSNPNGLEIVSNSDATINCSSITNNPKYGIEDDMPDLLTLNGVTFANNASGDTYISAGGTQVINPMNCSHSGKSSGPIVGGAGPLPWNVITVPDSGGQGNPLSCSQYVGTELVLPNSGDRVLLPCPIGSTPGTSGSISPVTSNKLPGTALGSKFTFVRAFDVEVNPALTGGMMTVSFAIPSDKAGANFAILHWDGTDWVKVGGSINPPGFFSATTNLTGDFVLVTQ